MALVTLSEVKEYLGITSTDYDDLLTTISNSVTEYFEGYCHRSFSAVSTYIQWWSIADEVTDTVRCEYVPIVSFIQLSDDGDKVDADNYYVDYASGLVRLKDGTFFTKGVAMVCASYTHGYSSVPDDIKLAAKMAVASIFYRRKSHGIVSARLGDFAYKVSDEPIPPEVRSILSRYRSPV